MSCERILSGGGRLLLPPLYSPKSSLGKPPQDFAQQPLAPRGFAWQPSPKTEFLRGSGGRGASQRRPRSVGAQGAESTKRLSGGREAREQMAQGKRAEGTERGSAGRGGSKRSARSKGAKRPERVREALSARSEGAERPERVSGEAGATICMLADFFRGLAEALGGGARFQRTPPENLQTSSAISTCYFVPGCILYSLGLSLVGQLADCLFVFLLFPWSCSFAFVFWLALRV